MEIEAPEEPFAPMHQVLVAVSAFSLVGLILICSAMVPYILIRWGFGFSP